MNKMKKSLHVAKSMDALDEMIKIPNLAAKTALSIAKSAHLVVREGDSDYLNGDEERAYIFYMKYFQLIDLIRKSKTYEREKVEIRKIIRDNETLHNYMDRLECIKNSLSERYKELEASEANMKTEVNANEVSNTNKNPLNGTITEAGSKWIKCDELHGIIRDKTMAILLLDCRHGEEYAESRIDFENIINIPQVNSRLSASKLREQIDDSAKKLFDRRSEMDMIILIDWDISKRNQQDPSKPIWALYQALDMWDPNTEYKSKPKLLDGGFVEFLLRYPMKTTNPKYTKRQSNESPPVNMAEIEYPSFDEIKMKEKTADGRLIPRVDRSNKTIAKRRFEDSRRSSITVGDIVKETEMKIEQAIKKGQEVMSISNELENVLISTKTVNDPNEKKEWFDKQMELGNQLVQKESELNDTVRELESDKPPDFDNNLSRLQITEPETLARLKAKKNVLFEMEKSRNEKNKKLEEKWRFSLAQQKQLREIEEEQTKPKMPTFDRSIKPLSQEPRTQREFSPVRGSFGPVGATGLKNLGNTCYMNSIIQCLSNLEPLCQYLKDGSYKRQINYKSKTKGTITMELAMLCSVLWSGENKSISPRHLRYVIGQHQRMFSGYDQQDSHEFLTILIDMLNTELQCPIEIDPEEKLSDPEKAWREFVKNTVSPIHQLFFGQIRSTLKCVCGNESPTYEGFSNISLELPSNNEQCDLYDCLDSYFYGERIDGWTCPACKQSREAIKKLDISKLPEILVIHLKRFHVNLHSSMNTTYQKKQNYVEFPIREFNIEDYITLSAKKYLDKQLLNYDLCGVSNHYGTIERGHYTAFCKNYKTKCWFKFDDNYVTQISSREVNTSAAYILFYMRN